MPRWLGSIIALAALITNAGCSPVDILNDLVAQNDFTVQHDLVYGTEPRQTLDIYSPRPARDDAPIVIFFYGGSWDSGTKADYLFVGAALASRGFITIIPDYRLYPDIRFPVFLEDSARAVRWARDHAEALGGNPHKIFLYGHSAGAYNAAMLAIDRQWLNAVGMDPCRDLAGIIGLAGPYDFLPLESDLLRAIFGPEKSLPQTQPINFVNPAVPPMFLATAKTDDTVDPGNSSRLAKALRAKGVPVVEKSYSGVGHDMLVGTIAAPLRIFAPVLKDSVAFLHDRMAATENGASCSRSH